MANWLKNFFNRVMAYAEDYNKFRAEQVKRLGHYGRWD
jgi:hypothetical protein